MKNNAKKGGLLKGKSHKKGGIKGIIEETNQSVELEGGEIIINKKSSELFREELSDINQAGGGVPIPSDQKKYQIYKDGGELPDSIQSYRNMCNKTAMDKFDAVIDWERTFIYHNTETGEVKEAFGSFYDGREFEVKGIEMSLIMEMGGIIEKSEETSENMIVELKTEVAPIIETISDYLVSNGIELENESHKIGVGTYISIPDGKYKISAIIGENITLVKEKALILEPYVEIKSSFVELIKSFIEGKISIEGFSSSEFKEFARILNSISIKNKIELLNIECSDKSQQIANYKKYEQGGIIEDDEIIEEEREIMKSQFGDNNI